MLGLRLSISAMNILRRVLTLMMMMMITLATLDLIHFMCQAICEMLTIYTLSLIFKIVTRGVITICILEMKELRLKKINQLPSSYTSLGGRPGTAC